MFELFLSRFREYDSLYAKYEDLNAMRTFNESSAAIVYDKKIEEEHD